MRLLSAAVSLGPGKASHMRNCDQHGQPKEAARTKLRIKLRVLPEFIASIFREFHPRTSHPHSIERKCKRENGSFCNSYTPAELEQGSD
jgi:hypothetical protein